MKVKLLFKQPLFYPERNFLQLSSFIILCFFSIFGFSQSNGISFDCLQGGSVIGTITFGAPDGTDSDGFATWSNGTDGFNTGYTLQVEDDNGPKWSVRQPGNPGPRFFFSTAVLGEPYPSCESADWQPDLFCDGVVVSCVPGVECDVNVTINSPLDPVPLGSNITLFADFSGFTPVDATWSFSSDGVNFEIVESGSVVGSTIQFDNLTAEVPAGVYTIKLEVTDECGDVTEFLHDVYLVIFDPDGGFVTGGGWINSPAGALVGTSTEGTVNFGLVAKYKKNTDGELNGNTNFKFQEGDFHFKSSDYDDMSLVISGGKKATYRGTGTVNGSGNHKFLVIAMDGDAQGGDGYDKLRVKIWADGSNSIVIYDNEIGSPENADASTILGGGSVVIHKPNNKNVEPELDTEFEMTSWPNPFQNQLNLRINSTNDQDLIALRIYDISGKLIITDNIQANRDIKLGSKLVSGMYFVTIEQGDNVSQAKLIKN